AVCKWVGIVVLNGAQSTAGKVYEATCKLKAVISDTMLVYGYYAGFVGAPYMLGRALMSIFCGIIVDR
ncbi:hypothetical protein TorRG33x02_149300, partial [Trema orientale]